MSSPTPNQSPDATDVSPITPNPSLLENTAEFITNVFTDVSQDVFDAISDISASLTRGLTLTGPAVPKFLPAPLPGINNPPSYDATSGLLTLSVEEQGNDSQFVDGQIWKLRVELSNSSVQQVSIPGNYIHELVLEHSVIDPCYWKGSMIVRCNRFGILQAESPDEESAQELIIRGDGRDLLQIQIKPAFPGSTSLPTETWDINSEFVVYDTEDISWDSESGMAKKIYFWHKGFHLLNETGATFSTAYLAPEFLSILDITKATNEQRMVPIGRAIQGALEFAGLGVYIDYANWDIGSADNKIFFTSTPNSTFLDVVWYLVSRYISTDGGPGLLYFHRGKNKFQLLGLQHFFERAGTSTALEYYMETFIIGSSNAGYNQDSTPASYKTPIPGSSNAEYDISLQKYNLIKDNSYTISDPAGSDSINTFVSHMIHTYDSKYKTFKIYYENSEISAHRTYFQNNFVTKLFPGNGRALLPLNPSKTSQRKVNQRFIEKPNTTHSAISRVGANYLIMSTIFLNLGINFKVQGSTHRHAGRFIGIDKVRSSENKYDYRMLGQWFVTSVNLRWSDNALYNEIVANKVSSHADLGFVEA